MPATVVIAPDSFKGSLSAVQVAAAIGRGWASVRPSDHLEELPMADGGEGTLDALAAADPRACTIQVPGVLGPDSRPHPGKWLLLDVGSAAITGSPTDQPESDQPETEQPETDRPEGAAPLTAVCELAQTSGLPLCPEPDPMGAHTIGLGQVLASAIDDTRVRRILVGLGGSASTDGGLGMLTALGARALDEHGDPVPPGGLGLSRVVTLDLSGLPARLGDLELVTVTDVDSPLLGPEGAAAVFGPQKGADAHQIAELDRGLARLAEVVGVDPQQPGFGAAGGCGFALAAVLGARIAPGAVELTRMLGLDELVDRAEVLITGEGRLDATSLRGKVVGHLLSLPGAHRRIVIAGQVDDRMGAEAGGTEAGGMQLGGRELDTFELSSLAGSSDQAMQEPERWLYEAGARAAERFSRLRGK